VYHAFSAAVRRITPFSFVVVTLYMVATLVADPVQGVSDPVTPFIDFVLFAWTWCKYVFFCLISGESLTPPQHVSVYMR
jgi:hypothetical protein